MATILGGDRGATSPIKALSRLPTGAKLFLILSAALLPLALIAIVATLQTSRVADTQARARLRVAATESARDRHRADRRHERASRRGERAR